MATINVHPIFVHFPIALLVVYTLLEVLRFPILTRQQWWFPAKVLLLFTGVAGGLAAIASGNVAQTTYLHTSTISLVRLHSTYAQLTIALYALLMLSYLIQWIRRSALPSRLSAGMLPVWRAFDRVDSIVFRPFVLMLASFVGMILLTVVGALGGAIVYGPNVDPVVSVVYHLLVK